MEGAVYHDQGIRTSHLFQNQDGQYDFRSFMAPIVNALKRWGAAAIDGE